VSVSVAKRLAACRQQPRPNENLGFRRPEAYLIIMKRLVALLIGGVAVLAAGCDARSLDVKTPGGTGNTITGAGATTGAGGTIGVVADGGAFVPTRKIDMLFLVDDSSEMRLSQDNFIRNFPVFIQRLTDPPGLPDLHIAVVSSDLGAGDGSIASCDSTGGKGGAFQYTARGDCTATGLAPGATYIADDGTNRNYTGNLTDVFACIAALGETGCGFEHQLAAISRALGADGLPAPIENQGFLRPDAFLVITVLTNEDDCSAPRDTNLYDTAANMNLASYLGPPTNFRCNEFGHLCNGVRPPRLAPRGDVTATVTLDGCVSAEDGVLIPVAEIVRQIRSVKPFPDQQIVVAAIAGPATPYTVKWHTPYTSDVGPWPLIAHSCMASDGSSFADPGVRIHDWVQAFGVNGTLLSICTDNYGPALDRVAALLPR
jgi:hypothetical protein